MGSLDYLFDSSLLQEARGMDFPAGDCSIVHAPADDNFVRQLTETVAPVSLQRTCSPFPLG